MPTKFQRRARVAARLLAAVAVFGAISLQGAVAQDTDKVLATVDGKPITQGQVDIAAAELGQNLQGMTDDQKREAVLNILVNVRVVANAAEAAKLGDDPAFASKLAFLREKALMETLLEQESKKAASEDAMKALYDEEIKKVTPEEEVHARHILFRTEEGKPDDEAKAKAEAALKRVQGGEDFGAVAKELTEDPSGKENGGDLGFFTKDQMVQPFAEAAFKLEPGKVSELVKSQFGWHIIKVEEKRTKPLPTFEQVKSGIQDYLSRKAQQDLVAKLRAAAKVEIVGAKPEGAPADAAPTDAAPAEGTPSPAEGSTDAPKQP